MLSGVTAFSSKVVLACLSNSSSADFIITYWTHSSSSTEISYKLTCMHPPDSCPFLHLSLLHPFLQQPLSAMSHSLHSPSIFLDLFLTSGFSSYCLLSVASLPPPPPISQSNSQCRVLLWVGRRAGSSWGRHRRYRLPPASRG